MSACCFTNLSEMQLPGSSAQLGLPWPGASVVQRKRSQVIQPIGGVRARPLSRALAAAASAATASAAAAAVGRTGVIILWESRRQGRGEGRGGGGEAVPLQYSPTGRIFLVY